MIDTHCHLNFEAFEGRVGAVIHAANAQGVNHFIVPGTDIPTSQKAIAIAKHNKNTYAAVGIHPHHVFENSPETLKHSLTELESLLKSHTSIVAVGEVGLDRHYYDLTKYNNYAIDESFIGRQKQVLEKQIKLAIKYNKSLILHNREAKEEFLEVIKTWWNERLAGRTVFHCCEPDNEFIAFAKERRIYIGVDGDVTFNKEKQEFIKQVPLEMLVLETDAPFLTPEPIRSSVKKRPKNEPQYLMHIAQQVAFLKKLSWEQVAMATSYNAQSLFNLPQKE